MPKKRKPKTPMQHLKHWFVPHKHNDHRPHLIRWHGLALTALLIMGVQISASLMQPPAIRALTHGNVLAYATDITPTDLLDQTNQQRVAAGLAPLRMDARLNQSASLKATNMFAENYWAHVSPSGIQPWYWFTQAGYGYTYAGENLAKDFDTTSGTIQGWMNSPGHRANILNPHYTDVGFAVQNGTLVGGETTLVVAHYGTVAGVSVAATVPAATPKPVAAKPAPVVVAATPAPTPVPTAAPSPTPSLAPVGTPRSIIAASQTISSAPPPQQYSLFKPLSLVRTLNLGTLVTIGLLIVLLIVYLITHITVWRKGLGRWRSAHYHLVTTAQMLGLVMVITLLAASGFGKVG